MFGATYFGPVYFGRPYFGPVLTVGAVSNLGDDAGGKRPILYLRDKRIIKALEEIADIRIVGRTSEKRKAVKAIKEAVAEIDLPGWTAPISNALNTALNNASRAAGDYNAFQDAAHKAVALLNELIAALRKRRREEEDLVTWLWL